ncbi:MAG TPA: GAF domain-containing protein, partial [Acetobacteraceae bacterium]|nr:GAF domain-containing protein [Acetobacteraceae bacterium]
MGDGGVPASGGEMGARIRAHDWASTPIGPMEAWPASLRTAVGIMLGTRHPASIAWGADLVCLCNDAFARRVGPARHLAVLGRPAREVPLLVEAELRQVMERGEPTWHEGRPVSARGDGRTEEVHWTYSHGPIHEPAAPNGVGGILTLVAETTGANLARRESEARYRSLLGALDEGFCVLELIFDEASRPVDYRFLETNMVFEHQTGLRDVVGRRVRELVPGIESFWPETYGRVALTGEPTRFVDRAGAMGRWFDVYACRVGPPRDRQVAVLFRDITARVQAEGTLRELERRQGFLLRLNDALRPLRDTWEIEAEACRLLGQHLGVAQVGFGAVDQAQQHVTVRRDWNDGRIASVAGTWRMEDFGPAFIADMRRGLTAAIPDIAEDPRTNAPEVRRVYAAIGTRAILYVPLLREGRQVAMLFIHHPEPRAWTPAEVALVEELAGRLWSIMERARTEAALRDSEAWLRLAQEAAEMGVYERDLA